MQRKWITLCAALVVLVGSGFIIAADKNEPAEQERPVKESEVPAAALATLKKHAGATAITEFAEEIEHGSKFYEGSWKGPDGHIDVLVTEAGDLVEIEEATPADKVPAGVKAKVAQDAGKDAKLSWEKKTVVLYEVHFTKDGKARELVLTADGRVVEDETEDRPDEDDKKGQ